MLWPGPEAQLQQVYAQIPDKRHTHKQYLSARKQAYRTDCKNNKLLKGLLTSENGFCKARSWRCRTLPGCNLVKNGKSDGCIKLSWAPCRTSRPCRACSVAGRFSARRPTTCIRPRMNAVAMGFVKISFTVTICRKCYCSAVPVMA